MRESVVMPDRRRKYDWEKWADGEEHSATYGEDFECGVPSFVALLHTKCNRLTMDHVRTSVNGNTVTFKYFKTPEE